MAEWSDRLACLDEVSEMVNKVTRDGVSWGDIDAQRDGSSSSGEETDISGADSEDGMVTAAVKAAAVTERELVGLAAVASTTAIRRAGATAGAGCESGRPLVQNGIMNVNGIVNISGMD